MSLLFSLFISIISAPAYLEDTPDWASWLLGPKEIISSSLISARLGKFEEPAFNPAQLLPMTVPRTLRFSGRFTYLRDIGRGSFGSVALCQSVADRNKRVAIKVMPAWTRPRQEERILRYLAEGVTELPSHQGRRRIVEFLGAFEESPLHYCLIFEALHCSLCHLMNINRAGLTIPDIRQIAIDCLSALDYCHSLGICHTDIKHANIALVCSPELVPPPFIHGSVPYHRPVLSKSGVMVKLIDFGSARTPGRHLITTLQYRSPEVLMKQSWDTSTDIWSLGCVLAELCGNRYLVANSDEGAQNHMVTLSAMLKSGLKEMVYRHCGDLFSLLHEGMLRMVKASRVSAREALGHRFFRQTGSEEMSNDIRNSIIPFLRTSRILTFRAMIQLPRFRLVLLKVQKFVLLTSEQEAIDYLWESKQPELERCLSVDVCARFRSGGDMEVEKSLRDLSAVVRGIPRLLAECLSWMHHGRLPLTNSHADHFRVIGMLAFSELKCLDLSGTRFVDLRPVSRLINLEVLRLNRVPVEDLAPLANLLKLEELELSETLVTDLRPLSGLVGLKALYLAKVPGLKDIRPLSTLINLEIVSLYECPIDDFTPVLRLGKVRRVYLGGPGID